MICRQCTFLQLTSALERGQRTNTVIGWYGEIFISPNTSLAHPEFSRNTSNLSLKDPTRVSQCIENIFKSHVLEIFSNLMSWKYSQISCPGKFFQSHVPKIVLQIACIQNIHTNLMYPKYSYKSHVCSWTKDIP